jgi:hypothetical protein
MGRAKQVVAQIGQSKNAVAGGFDSIWIKMVPFQVMGLPDFSISKNGISTNGNLLAAEVGEDCQSGSAMTWRRDKAEAMAVPKKVSERSHIK